MKIVGERLEAWAHCQKEIREKDLFSRSAFNRYYYSVYLTTRKMLGDLESKWRAANHSDAPDLLINAVRTQTVRQLTLNRKKGLITHDEMSRLRQSLQVATAELSNLLNEAYQLRGIADYEPEILIKIEGKVISLGSYKLSTAHGWPDRANGLCKTIRKTWADAGLVKSN